MQNIDSFRDFSGIPSLSGENGLSIHLTGQAMCCSFGRFRKELHEKLGMQKFQGFFHRFPPIYRR